MEERFFSYSRILSYATCPMKYYWEYVYNIVPIEKPKALSFGHCMSRGLEAYRRTGTLKDAKEMFFQAWIEEGKNLKQKLDPDNPKDFRTVERGFEILEDYTKEYPNEHEVIIQPEVKFTVPMGILNETKIIFRGRIDGVLWVGKDAAINEDKTTSILGEKYLPNLRDSLQIALYLWAADESGLFKLGGKTITPRCLMNVIRVHPEKYEYKRDIAIKSRMHLHSAVENALQWIDRILASEKSGIFPKNDADNSVCTKYGGCSYLPLRYKNPSIIESLIKTEYKQRPKREWEKT